MTRAALAVLACLVLPGCPDGKSGAPPAPSAHCTQREAQCKLGTGILGVCSEVECPAGQAPPCLSCMPQH